MNDKITIKLNGNIVTINENDIKCEGVLSLEDVIINRIENTVEKLKQNSVLSEHFCRISFRDEIKNLSVLVDTLLRGDIQVIDAIKIYDYVNDFIIYQANEIDEYCNKYDANPYLLIEALSRLTRIKDNMYTKLFC